MPVSKRTTPLPAMVIPMKGDVAERLKAAIARRKTETAEPMPSREQTDDQRP